MKIGPKYKIARRLGAPIFEKTQTQKYSLRQERKSRSKFQRPKTDFGKQLNEKQKARMFYGVTERQFSKYVKEAITQKQISPANHLFSSLEHRLDNTVWRAGILPTHLSARQAVAHGHFLINGRRVYTPSYRIKKGDKISIRPGSRDSKLFADMGERIKETTCPVWLSWDAKEGALAVKAEAASSGLDLLFDLGQVIEYYQR